MDHVIKNIGEQILLFIKERYMTENILKKGIYNIEDMNVFNSLAFVLGFSYFKVFEPKLISDLKQPNVDVIYGLICEILEIIYSIEGCINAGSIGNAMILIRVLVERVLTLKILFGRKNSVNKRITFFKEYDEYQLYNRKEIMKTYLQKLSLLNPKELKKGKYTPFLSVEIIRTELLSIDKYLKKHKRRYLFLKKRYKGNRFSYRYNPIFNQKDLSITELLKRYNEKDFNVREDLSFYGVLSDSVHTSYTGNKTNCNYGYVKDEESIKRDLSIVVRLFLSSTEDIFKVFSRYLGDDGILKYYLHMQSISYGKFKLDKGPY